MKAFQDRAVKLNELSRPIVKPFNWLFLFFILFLHASICVYAGYGGGQGDQIGWIFAHWVIVYFGQFFKSSK
jgi:hypothetical protein